MISEKSNKFLIISITTLFLIALSISIFAESPLSVDDYDPTAGNKTTYQFTFSTIDSDDYPTRYIELNFRGGEFDLSDINNTSYTNDINISDVDTDTDLTFEEVNVDADNRYIKINTTDNSKLENETEYNVNVSSIINPVSPGDYTITLITYNESDGWIDGDDDYEIERGTIEVEILENEFNVTPDEIYLNWTTDYEEDITIEFDADRDFEFEVLNGTTEMNSTYGQYDAYDIDEESIYWEDCLYPSGERIHNNPLAVKVDDEWTNVYSSSNVFDFSLIHNTTCPPGHYAGNVTINATDSGLNESVYVEIEEPIRQSNILDEYGTGTFHGIMPANTSDYHSYYFNASGEETVENATSVMIQLSDVEAELYILDFEHEHSSESIYMDRKYMEDVHPFPDNFVEVGVYGNVSEDTDYTGDIFFSTLNTTNVTDFDGQDATISEAYLLGDISTGENKTINYSLKNEGAINQSNLEESKDLYNIRYFDETSEQDFLLPHYTKNIEIHVSWDADVDDMETNLSYPDGSEANMVELLDINRSDLGKDDYLKEFLYEPEGSEIGKQNEGMWNIEMVEEPLYFSVKFEVYPGESIKTNFSDGTDIYALGEDNSSQDYNLTLDVPEEGFPGRYYNHLSYESDTGSIKMLPLTFDVDTPMLVGNDTFESMSFYERDNVGFNRTEVHGFVFEFKNMGNEDLEFDGYNNSEFLNNSDNYIEYDFEFVDVDDENVNESLFYDEEKEVLTPYEEAEEEDLSKLYLKGNVSIDTEKTNNETGLYNGWVYLNATESSPYDGFNVSLAINLTDELVVDLNCSDCGVLSEEGEKEDWIENKTLDENITINNLVSYVDGTYINDTLDLRNFTVWLSKEKDDGTYYYPDDKNLTTYSRGGNKYSGDVWSSSDNIYDITAEVLVGSDAEGLLGGNYSVHLEANHAEDDILYSGQGVHEYLVVNASGLEGVIDRRIRDFSEDGEIQYFNVTFKNHGPLGAYSLPELELDDDCSDYIDISVVGERPLLGGYEEHQYVWELEVDGEEEIEDCEANITFDDERDRYHELSIRSFDIETEEEEDDDDDDDDDIYCYTEEWENVECGGWDCDADEMYQEREVDPSGCDDEKRCIEKPEKCGVKDISLELEEGEVDVVQNDTSSETVIVTNSGGRTLDSLKLNISEEIAVLGDDWYSYEPEAMKIEADNVGYFQVDYDIAPDFPPGSHQINYTVFDADIKENITGYINVHPGEEGIIEMNETYYELVLNYTSILEKLDTYRDMDLNVSDFDATISEINSSLNSFEVAVEEDDLLLAYEELEAAKSHFNTAQHQAEELEIQADDLQSSRIIRIVIGIIVIGVIGLLIYLLLPPKEGYQPETGRYQHISAEGKSALVKLKEGFNNFKDKVKELLGMKRDHKYNYTGWKKWTGEEEEDD